MSRRRGLSAEVFAMYLDTMRAGYDTPESLQEEYVKGGISLSELERRLENMLRYAAEEER